MNAKATRPTTTSSPTRGAPKAAWSNLNPNAGFEPIAGAVAVLATQVDRCIVNGEEVIPQPGGFDGGSAAYRLPVKDRPWRQPSRDAHC